MKKNAVILILTAVCLLEFVFIITAWNRRPSGGMTAAQEENGEEEEITEEGEAAGVQEDAALREKADTEFQAAGAEENPGIDFSEGLEINIDGRSFAAEDAPENEAEKAVVLFYVADFLPNNLMRAESLAQQNGLFRTELENHRRADQNGERTNAYILHNIETVDPPLWICFACPAEKVSLVEPISRIAGDFFFLCPRKLHYFIVC